jgi:hypothetical protein
LKCFDKVAGMIPALRGYGGAFIYAVDKYTMSM